MALEWIYKLDEGVGDQIINTGSNTQGNYADKPIYDTDALMGDGARYIEIPQVMFSAGDDFRIKFEAIVADSASRQQWMGDNAALTQLILLSDEVQFYAPSVGTGRYTWASSIGAISSGQHMIVEIVRTGINAELFLNNVSYGLSTTVGSPDIPISQLYGSDGANFLPANSALQNVILENLTTGEAIGYKINEGSGLDVIAYDIVNGEFGAPVPAKNGTVTPNADWQYIPEYSNNGAWTPDTEWTFIADNSRFYPMNEGTGDVFKAYDEQGVPTPVNDATIQNFDESGWA